MVDRPVAGLRDVQQDLGEGAGKYGLHRWGGGGRGEREGREDPGAAVVGAPEVGAGAIARGGREAGGGLGYGSGGAPGMAGEEVCEGK